MPEYATLSKALAGPNTAIQPIPVGTDRYALTNRGTHSGYQSNYIHWSSSTHATANASAAAQSRMWRHSKLVDVGRVVDGAVDFAWFELGEAGRFDGEQCNPSVLRRSASY